MPIVLMDICTFSQATLLIVQHEFPVFLQGMSLSAGACHPLLSIDVHIYMPHCLDHSFIFIDQHWQPIVRLP